MRQPVLDRPDRLPRPVPQGSRLVEDFHYSAWSLRCSVPAISRWTPSMISRPASWMRSIIYTTASRMHDQRAHHGASAAAGCAHLQPAPKGLGDPKGDVEMFPSAWTVFEQIAPIYMRHDLWCHDQGASAQSRAPLPTAMDSATKNANDMIRELQLEYNRTRQGSSTQEITEIIGGVRLPCRTGRNKTYLQISMKAIV